jgi:hypothetical protein
LTRDIVRNGEGYHHHAYEGRHQDIIHVCVPALLY